MKRLNVIYINNKKQKIKDTWGRVIKCPAALDSTLLGSLELDDWQSSDNWFVHLCVFWLHTFTTTTWLPASGFLQLLSPVGGGGPNLTARGFINKLVVTSWPLVTLAFPFTFTGRMFRCGCYYSDKHDAKSVCMKVFECSRRLTVTCSPGAVSDVEMQEHYDEFFEVSRLFRPSCITEWRRNKFGVTSLVMWSDMPTGQNRLVVQEQISTRGWTAAAESRVPGKIFVLCLSCDLVYRLLQSD